MAENLSGHQGKIQVLDATLGWTLDNCRKIRISEFPSPEDPHLEKPVGEWRQSEEVHSRDLQPSHAETLENISRDE
jgi:hypothetical protein